MYYGSTHIVHIACLRVTKWLEDEPERKRRKLEEKKKRRVAKKVPPKHFFDDHAYMEQLRSNEEGMDDALKQGALYRKCGCLFIRNPYTRRMFNIDGEREQANWDMAGVTVDRLVEHSCKACR